MSDFSVRSDNVDVEQIMRQIRSRIREKRGVDYTEDEIRELANVKLEKFIDPKGVRSDLLQQYRQAREASLPPNYKFEDTTLFETHRGLLAFVRRLLRPVLKLFLNPNPLIDALHIQSKLNDAHARSKASCSTVREPSRRCSLPPARSRAGRAAGTRAREIRGGATRASAIA